MAAYDPKNRQVGQVDEAEWQLMDFLGPAERWSKMGNESDGMYLFVRPDEKSFFFRNIEVEEADIFWRGICDIVKYVPLDSPLNQLFKPYKP
jgi:hypothetical protein